MTLAVAGIQADDIEKRTKQLSQGDWSLVTPAERLALRFALKVSRTPWEVNDKDRQALVATFGRHRAADIAWRSAWCNYMIRVADAFQFTLEKENVFMPPKK